MKRLRLEHVLAWLLLVIMGLIVVHAPLAVFIESQWPGVADIAKAWKELLLLTALLLLCVKITIVCAFFISSNILSNVMCLFILLILYFI